MKILTTTILAVFALVAVPTPSIADVYAAITSAIPDAATRDQIYRQLSLFALRDLKPGQKLIICDGWEAKPVATIEVPSDAAYANNLKARAKAMGSSLKGLADFMRHTSESPPGVPPYGLDVPKMFTFLAENTQALHDHSAILFAGSAIVATPEPAFQFKDGLVASDQHVRVSRNASVYGLQGTENRLTDCNIYWATLGGGWLNDAHLFRSDRFWRLFCQVQGAKLAAFTPDPSTVMTQLAGGNVRPLVPVELDSLEKLEMTRVKPYDLATSPLGEVMTAEVNQATVPPVMKSRVPRAVIGIRWDGNVDVDLYVQPDPSARELSYKYNTSSLGNHKKDWTSEPIGTAYEMVELLPQPNGGTFDLSTLRVSVNLYRGSATVKEVKGVLRMAVENHIYEQTFRFKSSAGNGGKDDQWEKRAASGNWVVIDVPRLCKIGERQQ